MRIALLGATGRTGRLVITEAHARGHRITALARTPESLGATGDDGLRVHAGDIRDSRALAAVVDGVDAVISAIGARGRDPELHTVLARNTIDAMRAAGVSRFVGISVAGLDLPGDQKGRRDRIIGALARALAGAATADRTREYEAWRDSGLSWTLVRVPRLVDREAGLPVSTSPHTPPRGIALHRASLASLLVDCATTDRFAGAAPFAADA